jgi:hypothetical protein
VQVPAARVQAPERVRALARAPVQVPEQAAQQRVLARVQQARRVPQVLPQLQVLQPPSFRP